MKTRLVRKISLLTAVCLAAAALLVSCNEVCEYEAAEARARAESVFVNEMFSSVVRMRASVDLYTAVGLLTNGSVRRALDGLDNVNVITGSSLSEDAAEMYSIYLAIIQYFEGIVAAGDSAQKAPFVYAFENSVADFNTMALAHMNANANR